MVRRPAVAGTWYPANAEALTRQVEGYLDATQTADQSRAAIPERAALVALIAPHAGLMYSGPVAAHAYQLLPSRRFEAIVLVGPSHYVGFDGASVWPAGSFATPLRDLAIDADLADRIRRVCPILSVDEAPHHREHSLEMQLPFLATLAPETPIVPIVMGYQTRETAVALGDAIALAVGTEPILLVASSDLSHFYDADTAATLDARVIERVDAFDDEGLMELFERRADHACGGGPMVSVLRAARRLGGTKASVLRYGDSGDISGDKSSVVGYMAAAVWR